MATYKEALEEFKAWSLTIIPNEPHVVRRYSVPFYEGDRRITEEFQDTEMIFSEAQQSLILEHWEKVSLLSEYEKQAFRQVYVADACIRIRTQGPKEFIEKLVAVTISPMEDTIQTCKNIMMILLRLSCFKLGGSYVYEQRTDGTVPAVGWHIHISLRTTYAPSKIEQFIKQSISKITHMRKVKKADDKWSSQYMMGLKGNDAIKISHVAGDKIHRAAEGLQDIYAF